MDNDKKIPPHQMSKQARVSEGDGRRADPSQEREDALVFSKLVDTSFGDDLFGVLKSINALEGITEDKGLEAQIRAKIVGKVVTLDNMSNSSFYRRRQKSAAFPAARELLSMNRAKELKVYDFPKPLTYSDLDELNAMWNVYAQAFFDTLRTFGASGCPSDVLPAEYRHSLLCSRIELLGAYLRVTNARNKQLIGITGRVCCEGENILQLIDERNKVRRLPKEVCTFSLSLPDGNAITLEGRDLIRNRLAHS